MNPFACNEEDHPARRCDECDTSAAKLAAFRRAFTSRLSYTGFRLILYIGAWSYCSRSGMLVVHVINCS